MLIIIIVLAALAYLLKIFNFFHFFFSSFYLSFDLLNEKVSCANADAAAAAAIGLENHSGFFFPLMPTTDNRDMIFFQTATYNHFITNTGARFGCIAI